MFQSDSASVPSTGLMSLPQDLLASILKDVAYSSNCKESPYSVGQHVEVEIHECFESSLHLKSLVRGWWGATITSVIEAGSEKMYMIKWDKLPAEYAERNDFFSGKGPSHGGNHSGMVLFPKIRFACINSLPQETGGKILLGLLRRVPRFSPRRTHFRTPGSRQAMF